MSKVEKYIRKNCLPQIYKPKSLGVLLREANLVSAEQIERALRYQIEYPDLSLGEILALQGWVRQKTSDFFVQDWSKLIALKERKALGYYLERAGLIEEKEIKKVLAEQEVSNLKFGTLAVLKGYIKPETLDFFLFYLFPEELGESHQRTRKSLRKSRQRKRQLIASIMKRTKSSIL
ncbi:MAG: hypothetical protein QNJ34_25900 [Xenococcaceae cyanobacterium MO_188.B29]|nr:hypothetical protein [Xenococcaceae cyanobacterium MO_188.B29]